MVRKTQIIGKQMCKLNRISTAKELKSPIWLDLVIITN